MLVYWPPVPKQPLWFTFTVSAAQVRWSMFQNQAGCAPGMLACVRGHAGSSATRFPATWLNPSPSAKQTGHFLPMMPPNLSLKKFFTLSTTVVPSSAWGGMTVMFSGTYLRAPDTRLLT